MCNGMMIEHDMEARRGWRTADPKTLASRALAQIFRCHGSAQPFPLGTRLTLQDNA